MQASSNVFVSIIIFTLGSN